MPYVSFIVVCVIWGSSFILMKRSMLCLSPVSIGAWRDFGGAMVLLLMFLATRQQFAVRRENIWPILGVALLGFVWPHSIQPELVGRIGGAFVGMTVGMTPLLTIAVSIPMLRVYPTPRQLFGVLGALVFMIALVHDGLRQSIALRDMLLAFSVPMGYSVANTWIRRSLRHLPPLELTLLCLLMASSILLPLSMFVGAARTINENDWPTALVAVATLGIVGTGIATLLFNKLVQDQGPLFAAMAINLIPIGAVLWGSADKENITPIQIVSLVGIVIMVTIVQYGSAQKVVQVEYE